jgi:general secretion pathway protein A
MVLDYYKLREQAFGFTADSRFLFLSATHREALGCLYCGIELGRGFVALIAKPGMGKTTLLLQALRQLPNTPKTIFLSQTISTPRDLLEALLTELGVREPRGSIAEMQSRLNEFLVEFARSGKRLVVAIDEAQNLDDSVLEMVRLLSNFETSRNKLIHIILCGQPQLADRIESPELVQLRQRISVIARLEPLSLEETALYIDQRMRTAGYGSEKPLFTSEALALIARFSQGIPRNINNLCFNALALGYALQRKTIDGDIIREVAADLDFDRFPKGKSQAEQQNEKGMPQLPRSLSVAAPAPSMGTGWLPKVAIVIAVLLLMGWALLGSHRWPSATAAIHVNRGASLLASSAGSRSGPNQRLQRLAPAQPAIQADTSVPSIVAAVPASPGASEEPRPPSPASTIRVAPGRTLRGICVENFGKCDPEVLQEIYKLNPRLSNPDHIEPGQEILIPLSPVAQSTTQPQGSASLSERGKR